MPNNITSSAAFVTTSMKPLPDEQIDALWGQNLADNTGFLRTSGLGHTSWFGSRSSSTNTGASVPLYLSGSLFNPVFLGQNHNKITGTVDFTLQWSAVASTPPDVFGTWKVSVEGDLGTYSLSGVGQATDTTGTTHATTVPFNTSLAAYVSPNTWAHVVLRVWGSSVNVSGVTNHAIAYDFGEAPKLYTSWA